MQESGLWCLDERSCRRVVGFSSQFSRMRLSVYSALRLSGGTYTSPSLLSLPFPLRSSNHVKTPAASFFVAALSLGHQHSADLIQASSRLMSAKPLLSTSNSWSKTRQILGFLSLEKQDLFFDSECCCSQEHRFLVYSRYISFSHSV